MSEILQNKIVFFFPNYYVLDIYLVLSAVLASYLDKGEEALLI